MRGGYDTYGQAQRRFEEIKERYKDSIVESDASTLKLQFKEISATVKLIDGGEEEDSDLDLSFNQTADCMKDHETIWIMQRLFRDI